MKIYILSLLFAVSHLYGLDAEAILKIADQPHNRENLVDALKIYPDAREYKVTARSGRSPDEFEAMPEVVAKEKVVEGRYVVSRAVFPGVDHPLIMVVSYEKETDTFKKWVLLPNGVVTSSTGIAEFEKRTIAWTSDKAYGEPSIVHLSIETHSDEKTTWKETSLQGGDVIAVSEGMAIKTK